MKVTFSGEAKVWGEANLLVYNIEITAQMTGSITCPMKLCAAVNPQTGGISWGIKVRLAGPCKGRLSIYGNVDQPGTANDYSYHSCILGDCPQCQP